MCACEGVCVCVLGWEPEGRGVALKKPASSGGPPSISKAAAGLGSIFV